MQGVLTRSSLNEWSPSRVSRQTSTLSLSLTLLAIRSLLCLSVLPHRNSKKYSRAPPAIIRRTAWMVK